jgi:hypothetical protein
MRPRGHSQATSLAGELASGHFQPAERAHDLLVTFAPDFVVLLFKPHLTPQMGQVCALAMRMAHFSLN